MTHTLTIELIGSIAAVLTTLCWLPQTLRVIRFRDTASLSLSTFSVFIAGVGLWMVYGIMLEAWPVILANLFTLGLNGVIVVQKLRHG